MCTGTRGWNRDCGGGVLPGFCHHNIQIREGKERTTVNHAVMYRNPNLSLDGNIWAFDIKISFNGVKFSSVFSGYSRDV